ncbi:MAG: family 43 glycosylhydrolase [Candidatus Eisenbacteria bacterium]|uniref:beta-fructofuranosidase n=1 Tax=Eiseniibacteriota bacterium TaxID=2212470 RepID=A0A849SG11_UNCEI|nr:family 43 glycosylhydrolase [Candidatus Eisenbacteria bacterium]
MPRVSARAVLVLAMLAFALPAVVETASAGWMIPPRPWRAKDFSILKRNGLYHIFYTRTNINDPNGLTENAIGHATSYDLFTWANEDSVLPIRPTEWDNHRVWAPHVIEVGGLYYMFYTGVTEQPGVYSFHQRTGLAVSSDLYEWNRVDAPIYECGDVPWSLCNPLAAAAGNLRDPFVMPDPSTPGRWLMYQSTVPASDPNRYVVDVAQSFNDFENWSDIGPLWETYHTTTNRELAESPHLFEHDGTWYLMFSTNGSEPIAWSTGLDPLADPSGWTYHGALANTLGFSTSFWFASEFMRDGSNDYFCFVNFDRVDIRRMVWKLDGTFGVVQPDFFHVKSLSWAPDSVEIGSPVTVELRSINSFGGRWVKLYGAEVDGGPPDDVLSAYELGLPDSVFVDDSLVTFPWIARRYHDADDADSTNSEVRILTLDGTAITSVLVVTPIGGCSGSGDPGEVIDPALRVDDHESLSLRTLQNSPTANGPVLLVQSDVPTHGRLEIFDVQGRRLGVLADRAFPRGASLVPWDGAAAAIAGARPGVRFVRLVTPQGQRWSKVLVTR